MNLDALRDAVLAKHEQMRREIIALFDACQPDAVVVPAGGNLQAALDRGGVIQLESGATYESQGFVVRAPAQILGRDAWLRGTSKPALTIPPGVNDVTVRNLYGASGADAVFQFGENDKGQTTLEAVPKRIMVSELRVPGHLKKRAFACHAADIVFEHPVCSDVYAVAGVDSQGIYIHNTPGPVTVLDAELSAGSEIILVGGDTPRIANLIPTGLTFQRCRLTRPLSWQTDGIARYVKNIFELKTGRQVRLTDCVLDGAWKDAQPGGFAFMFTPRKGGAIEDVLVENCRVRHCGGLVNILGQNDDATQLPTPFKTAGIVFRGGSAVICKAQFGGFGTVALTQWGVQSLTFDRYVAIQDGGRAFDIGADKRPHGSLTILDSYFTAGVYGITIAGRPNLRPPTVYNPAQPELGGVEQLDVRGNVFADAAPEFKKHGTGNAFVTRAEFDVLPEVQARLGASGSDG